MYIFFIIFIKILFIIVPLLISVAYFTLAERKILGAIHRRRGPNVVGVMGLLQPLSDGFKLFVKEAIVPSSSNKLIFILSPAVTFIISLLGWAIVPFNKYSTLAEINLGILYFLAISSLGIYGIIMSGWSSNSKYAFLGSLRSTAQMISYEVAIGFIITTIIISVGSFNLQEIIDSQKFCWFIITFFPLFLMFSISGLAETNRHPFDLPEAESELVSGYNVEYSAMSFALFSLGEYSNMLLMSSFVTILFLGGWQSPLSLLIFIPNSFWFGIKISFFVILFVWIRAALPRYRYDQLMSLGWKGLLPLSIAILILNFCILITFNMLPY
uniref:NADH-ubiquinone oxidoreductase chain 1 n=1 Tax=Synura synuroidea TaxID=47573 RepID=Q9MGA3_9STRA|nr:NADH dehydrogenase subunit 1 [Synura synuroidea]AAF36946.1 NADH dehydrogenase subunit 1 [Synura synuroidea]